MSKLRVGMVGFAHGHAYSYLNALQTIPQVAVTGLYDEERSRIDRIVQQDGITYYDDYRELLGTDIDAVVICAENSRHAALTIEAARSGKHVLCEKPLGVNKAEMEQMIQVCREQGVQLMTAFPCRYLPPIVEAKKAIESGAIGEILAIKGMNRGTMPGGWFIDPALSGGGAIMDHTVHVMDLMNWFVNSDVTEVYGEAGTLFHDIQVEDAGLVHVKFANGVIGVIDTSWSRTKSAPVGWDVVMEITGSSGVLTVDGFGQINHVYGDDKMKAQWSYWGDSSDDLMIQDFVRALAAHEDVPINGEDGLKATVVALAAYEAAKQKKPVVITG
ncbi:dehydrogenase [Paenibacillus sp. MY03]|uniref:Gfo/Idh/MocA family protein n=1 Tax=Paenibacillus sp. MY03 TaxID=302980 RepID=UPI000B3D3283|nr:Gfo/Idh/MocA family oxidoreductase [Paenibacillus sp. MY03]OUS70800.1 dehydrogenase [Paenibacillus sp. MY03]